MSERNHWHPAFVGATEWELKKNKKDLIFEPEHQLSKEPLRVDMLVVKKAPDAVIENEIGKIFKTHNLMEFKGYGDSFSIDDYHKVVGYACIYKALGKHVNEITAEEVTITVMRDTFPRELVKHLEKNGISFEEKYPGIYYITGNVMFAMQFIVTSRLDREKHNVLRILRRNAERSDVEKFILEARLAKDKDDLHNVDAVLQVSVAANKALYEEIRKEDEMCQALRDLMSDEIEKEVAEGRKEERKDAIVDNIKSLMQNMKWTAEQATKALGISDSEQSKYIAML
ncbi:MAG: hypothetical protein IJ058_01520 [Lachnospiraceae bacterium]|nr:hypothetical protein [Lachnospiraceae bacterium]